MAYEAFSGVGEDVGDTSFRRFGDDYSSYDSGMESSARWDSSFRAPEDFNADYLGVDDSAFDDFRGYHGHPAPIYENDDDQHHHLTPGMPAAASATATASSSSFNMMKFGSELSPSEFSQRGLYNTVPGSYSSNHLEARNSYSQQEIDEDQMFGGEMNGGGGGAVLPPPEEMQEEGQLLRQWKRQNALLLREKERVERDRLQQIRMDADEYKDTHNAKRTVNRETQMKNNRDKERVNLADQEHFHNNANKAYWKAVADLVPKELPTSLEPRALQLKERKKEKKPTFVALPGPKPGKPTDMGRMRQILLKLKHTPPAHMLPAPPQPPANKPTANASKENGHGQAGPSVLQEALQQPHQSVAAA